MQIFLQRPDGSTAPMQVEPSVSVFSVIQQALPAGANWRQFYLRHCGRVMDSFSCVLDYGVQEYSALQLVFRLLGGGGDGGATGAESRDCYLKMYAEKKPDKIDPHEQKLAKWTHCSLSSEVLKPPCVMDMLGSLFNKEALVQSLLRKTLPSRLRHIKGLKDVVDIQLATLPGIASDDETSSAKFQCPVTGQEFNGKFKFYALRRCGHVLSARALKELSETTCAVCLTPFSEAEKIVLNGSEEEVQVLRQKLDDEKQARAKSRGGKRVGCPMVSISGDPTVNDSNRCNVKVKTSRNGASKTAEPLPALRPKGSDLVQVVKRFKAEDHMPWNATKEVYSSIFTSSSKQQFKETYSCRSLPIGRN